MCPGVTLGEFAAFLWLTLSVNADRANNLPATLSHNASVFDYIEVTSVNTDQAWLFIGEFTFHFASQADR